MTRIFVSLINTVEFFGSAIFIQVVRLVVYVVIARGKVVTAHAASEFNFFLVGGGGFS